MLREGCRGYTAEEFAERLDYYGAWLELSVAMNRTFVTVYTLKKHFAPIMELVQCMITEPTYSEERFGTVCTNNKAQFMINMQKGNVLAMRALRQSIYDDTHPCGMNVTAEDYDALQVSDIVEYYHCHYGSRTCQIYLSGDVGDAMPAYIESLFGNKEWGDGSQDKNRKKGDEPPHPNNPDARAQYIRLESAVQDSIRMGCLLMDVNDPDYLSMRILTTILGGYFGSRLMKNVREEKGYTYHIGSDLATNTPQVMLMIHCEAQAGKADEVISEVYREMLRLHTEPISEDELLMVRNYMIGEICRNYESAFSLSDAYIFMEHLGLPPTHLEQTINAIRTTDAPRLQQLAQRYLRPEMLHTVVVKP